MARSSKAGSRTTGKATTDCHSAAVPEIIEASMVQSVRLLLTEKEAGHVGQCSACAGMLGALMQFVRIHAPAVEQISSTSPKPASKRSADRKPSAAKSRSK